MAERYSKEFETPEEAVRVIGTAIYQNEQIIKSASPSSAQFKKAKAALEKLRVELKKASDAVDTKRAEAKKPKVNVADAKDQYEREVALGKEPTARYGADGTSLVPGTEAYFKGTTDKPKVPAAPAAPTTPTGDSYTGSGTKDKPLELNGAPFSGTYKGKKYENGILVTEPTKTASGKGTGTGTGDGDGTKEDKTKWVSYLRLVFNTIEDKQQKAQIDKLFDDALKFGWSEETFKENLKGTQWWQGNFASFRQFILESKDPRNAGTFAEKVKNNMDSVTSKIEALGIAPRSVDPQTGKVIDNSKFIESIALEAIKNNWTDDQLENYLSTKSNIIFTGGGTIGSYLDRVKNTAYMYGVKLDANMEKAINTSLLDPLDGRDFNYWTNSMKQMAIDAPENKPFAESLKAGRSLYEVTTSYRNQMANLLEVDSAAITWDDLMAKVVDKTSGNARTFADFTKALKQDPLWQYTRNAKETYSGMALDLAKMFGFAG
jgi:hypothetical protein